MTKNYDQTCDCAVVHLTPADDKRFEKCPESIFAEFIRAAIESGTRSVSFKADCECCQGSGLKHFQSA